MWTKIGELWLQTHITVSFRYTILCVLKCITQKLQVVSGRSTYWTTALLSEIPILWVRAECEIQRMGYGSKDTSQSLSFCYDISCLLTCITQKLQVIYGCSAVWTTAPLLEMSIFWVRPACEIQLASYGSKHPFQICHLCIYFHA